MTWRASSGLRAWLMQRVSAVYMLLFTAYCILSWVMAADVSYAAWRAWVAQPVVNTGCALFAGALLAHAWVGVRDVIMDYIHPLWLRTIALSVLAVALSGLGIWILRILFKVAS